MIAMGLDDLTVVVKNIYLSFNIFLFCWLSLKLK